MTTMQTRWGKYVLSWFCSGEHWFVTAIDKRSGERLTKPGTRERVPVGCGRTRDAAFREFETAVSSPILARIAEYKKENPDWDAPILKTPIGVIDFDCAS